MDMKHRSVEAAASLPLLCCREECSVTMNVTVTVWCAHDSECNEDHYYAVLTLQVCLIWRAWQTVG